MKDRISSNNAIYFQIFFVVVCVLLIPLIAMQFTSEVSWSIGDFLVAAALLYILLLGLYFIWTKVKIKTYRIAAIIIAVLLFLFLWAELAVGIFGSPFAGH